MATLWFGLVAFMFVTYVVLDGFDLGVGAVHLLLARGETERKTLLATIGPVWDGNEVWLIGAGATLFMAFPALYAASFSGFFLPLMIVLWLLMGRGIALEFRNHLDHPVWRPFWDVVFSVSSTLLAVSLGVALGNVIRGLPLDASGQFFVPLWTGLRLTPPTGFIDWYTLLAGLLALAALTMHGSLWAAVKTSGDLAERARGFARKAWAATALLAGAGTIATFSVQPLIPARLSAHAEGLVFPALALAGLVLARWLMEKGADVRAFLSSCLFLAGLLASTAFGLFPYVLPSNADRARSLTVFAAASADHGLRVALWWWIPGMLLVTGTFVFLYRNFAGRVEAKDGDPARPAVR
jgi:cytochrome d ubiquinol oxidase subunit II